MTSTTDDLDFSEYDIKTEYKFNETYSTFVRAKGPDTVLINKLRLIRALARDELKKASNPTTETYIREHPKCVEINNLSAKVEDPHIKLGLKEKTSVQVLVDKHIPYLPYYGSFAYSCSCGSGKTIAGLQIIAGLQCRTLIISSRNAVNDQWRAIISKLYPKLVIEVKRKQYRGNKKLSAGQYLENADIYIDTPQYLARKLDKLTMKPSLIIFDEVHSLLSANYIRVLLFPMVQVLKGDRGELPYLVALSATYPPMNSRGYKSLMKLFGKAYRTESSITDIPVYIWDYYDHFRRVTRGKDGNVNSEVRGDDARGAWDMSYQPMNDCDAVEYFTDAIEGVNEDINAEIAALEVKVANMSTSTANVAISSIDANGTMSISTGNVAASTITANGIVSISTGNCVKPTKGMLTSPSKGDSAVDPAMTLNVLKQIKDIDPTDVNHKGIIMTYTIDSSAYAALYCHLRWNVPVLLIRSVDEPDMLIDNGPADVYELTSDVKYDDLVDEGIGIKCNYLEYIDKVPIIVGTFHRLKEGFSVQNITWGICTKFVWSYISRVQLVGRIRRASEDPELNSRTRILMCNTSQRPSNLRVPKAKKPYRWQYDMKVEKALFDYENYVRV